MTSILTNIASNTALQTLRNVNSELNRTQQQVSSGLRVQSASDDVAYWSISTTMRSDNKALSAAGDAMALGAAQVATAYEGTNSIIEVLTEFKAKLVTANEESADRNDIQLELGKLNEQAEAIVKSSSFSGSNWLQTAEKDHLDQVDELETSLVSSFARSKSGVAIQSMPIDLKTTSMLNTGGGGILQADFSGEVSDIGGFEGAVLYASAHNGHESHKFTGPATFSSTDYIEFSVVVDALDADAGVTFSNLRIDKGVVDSALGTTSGTIKNAVEMRTVLKKVFDDNGVPLWTTPPSGYVSFTSASDPTRYEIGSLETSGHNGSSINVFDVVSDFGGAHPAGFGLGLEKTPESNHDNMLPKVTLGFTEAFAISGDTEVYFDLQVDGGAKQTITIDQSMVDAALGTSDGHIADKDAFAAVLAYATSGTGVTATTTDPEFTGTITFLADPAIYPKAGNQAMRFNISNVRTNLDVPPREVKFDLAKIDITNPIYSVDQYLKSVDKMIDKAVLSAASLGAAQQGIELQTEFNERLMSSIDSGVSRLVDADMEEASARLAAAQTQQQLAVQSLQIANDSTSILMQLYSSL